jgi:hypothetical protein
MVPKLQSLAMPQDLLCLVLEISMDDEIAID